MIESNLLMGSRQPAYAITQDKTVVNEGDTVTFTIHTENVIDGTLLYWTTNISGADFTDAAASGTITVNENTATVQRTLKMDSSTEGVETFILQLRKNNVSGVIVAVSEYVTINDTSRVVPVGQREFTSVGTQNWTVPADVTSISIVAIGGGGGGGGGGSGSYYKVGAGGGGGGLGYANNVAVTPGQTLSITVGGGGTGGGANTNGTNGGVSEVKNDLGQTLIRVTGGGGGAGANGSSAASGGAGGNRVTATGGGAGGAGGTAGSQSSYAGGGGGGGGYSGSGGAGGASSSNGAAGGGGGGGGGKGAQLGQYKGGGGGGVGTYGQGTGGAQQMTYSGGGNGGSGGSNGTGEHAGAYGGGGGGGGYVAYSAAVGGNGGQGAVRIIWGSNRTFPNTNTGNL